MSLLAGILLGIAYAFLILIIILVMYNIGTTTTLEDEIRSLKCRVNKTEYDINDIDNQLDVLSDMNIPKIFKKQ